MSWLALTLGNWENNEERWSKFDNVFLASNVVAVSVFVAFNF